MNQYELMMTISIANKYALLAGALLAGVLLTWRISWTSGTKTSVLPALISSVLIAIGEILLLFAAASFSPGMPPTGLEMVLLGQSIRTVGLVVGLWALTCALKRVDHSM